MKSSIEENIRIVYILTILDMNAKVSTSVHTYVGEMNDFPIIIKFYQSSTINP